MHVAIARHLQRLSVMFDSDHEQLGNDLSPTALKPAFKTSITLKHHYPSTI